MDDSYQMPTVFVPLPETTHIKNLFVPRLNTQVPLISYIEGLKVDTINSSGFLEEFPKSKFTCLEIGKP